MELKTPLIKSRPTKPCHICKSDKWWYRKPRIILRSVFSSGEWLCGLCHPNPNKGEDMEDEIELVGNKFVVKDKEEAKDNRAKIKIDRTKPVKKEYSEELLGLRDRVIRGNLKLFNAWERIKGMDHSKDEWKAQMDRWHDATERLSLLCTELKFKGYLTCLYFNEEGKRTKNCLQNPNGFWCQVCPSTYPFWEEDVLKL